MSDPDQAIERVLHGLGHAEPPPQLEGRVIRTLEGRLQRQRPGGHALGRRPSLRGLLVATTCAVLLALLAGFVWEVRWSSDHARSTPVALEGSAAQRPNRPLKVDGVERSLPRATEAAAVRAPGGTPPNPPRERNREATVPRAKSLAEEEAEAPSLLAPPLPLTHSERLLLQMTEQGRPEEIALLTEQLSAAHDAQDRREFRDFFERSEPQHTHN